MRYIPPSSRITFLTVAVFLLAFVLLGKLFYMQILKSESFQGDAKDQYISQAEVFRRGGIYFTERDGDPVAAAIMKHGYILAIAPKHITDTEETYKKISGVLDIDKADFFTAAGKKDDPYEKIAGRLSETEAKRIRSMNLGGVGLYPETWRYYPGGDLASQVLGYYGYGDNGKTGLYGLESYYNKLLSRSKTDRSVNFFAKVFAGIEVNEKTAGEEKQDRDGSIYITIEPTVQRILEKNLKQAMDRWDAIGVGGIIMDPKTGKIYAMASLPDFNPNKYSKSPIRTYNNPLVQDVYEMGSIIKALTMASALDAGAVTLDTTYYDKGTRIISGLPVSNYDFVARGWTSMQNILNHSLNLGAIFLMEQMGHERFAQYFRNFGLNKRTGIDLPGEVVSELRLKDRHKVGYATAAFGQGIALSPIATIRALSALGNGGTLPEPHIVRKIEYDDGTVWKWQPPKEPVHVITPETSNTISGMLLTVMDDYMLGGTVDLPHHTIAAKTGTAQVVKPGGGYYENRYFHSYFGYYPAYDPQFIVFLYMEYPKNILYASHTLTKPFMDTAKFLLNYYSVPPDR